MKICYKFHELKFSAQRIWFYATSADNTTSWAWKRVAFVKQKLIKCVFISNQGITKRWRIFWFMFPSSLIPYRLLNYFRYLFWNCILSTLPSVKWYENMNCFSSYWIKNLTLFQGAKYFLMISLILLQNTWDNDRRRHQCRWFNAPTTLFHLTEWKNRIPI